MNLFQHVNPRYDLAMLKYHLVNNYKLQSRNSFDTEYFSCKRICVMYNMFSKSCIEFLFELQLISMIVYKQKLSQILNIIFEK